MQHKYIKVACSWTLTPTDWSSMGRSRKWNNQQYNSGI